MLPFTKNSPSKSTAWDAAFPDAPISYLKLGKWRERSPAPYRSNLRGEQRKVNARVEGLSTKARIVTYWWN